MRAFHLVGFRTTEGVSPRLVTQSDSPLVLPWWIPEGDREIILAFYQQVLAAGVMPRVEVDWHRSLLQVDRDFLRSIRELHNSTDQLIVVKVRAEGADLRDIMAQPELQAFEHIAVVAEFPLANVALGRLRELCGLVSTTAEDRYQQLATELSLSLDDGSLLEPLLRQLLNPILVLEAYNALVDVQAEGLAPGQHRDTIYQRILARLLAALPADHCLALATLATGHREPLGQVVGDKEEQIRHRLRDAMLLRDDQLVGWASLLAEKRLGKILAGRLNELTRPALESWIVDSVLRWYGVVGRC